MLYWGNWLGGLVGAMLAVLAFHIFAKKFEWPVIVALSIAVIVFCSCFLLGYLL